MKTMHLWVPDDLREEDSQGNKEGDREKPRMIALGGAPPLPGLVYVVEAKDAAEGKRMWALIGTPDPGRKKDKESWLAWDTARDSITHLATYAFEAVGVEYEATAPWGETKTMKTTESRLVKKERS